MSRTNSNFHQSIKINQQFHLSKIHRLLRPLKSSISSLLKILKDHQILQSNSSNHSHSNHFKNKKLKFYNQSKNNKSFKFDNLNFNPFKKNYNKFKSKSSLKSKFNHHPKNSNLSIISSPIFKNSNKFINNQNQSKIINSSHLDIEINLEIQIKIDKLILTYKNILDSICYDLNFTKSSSNLSISTSSNHNPFQLDRLTEICSSLIGRLIEINIKSKSNPINSISNSNSDSDSDSNLNHSLNNDWKTSLMDEWYDAVPLLYRRFALGQHALTLILINFEFPSNIQKSSKLSSFESSFHQKIFQAIHSLHRTYSHSTLIKHQTKLLLPTLFNLPSNNWFEIFDDYHSKFHQTHQFFLHFDQSIKSKGFLDFWCHNKFGLIDFIDLTIDQFATRAFQHWLNERESLIHKKLKSSNHHHHHHSNHSLGLHSSSDSSDLDPDLDLILDYDKRTGSILIKWLNSLVIASLPNSINCQSARIHLNSISRILFDSLLNSSNHPPIYDNSFLSILSITLESHRLALFGLAMFNTGSIDLPGKTPKWSSPHTPMRLQALIPLISNKPNKNIFNKSAKLFFRAHRSTRLLAILPGVFPSHHHPLIPGLDQLLRSVLEGDYALESVAKGWIDCLLQTDPASWWSKSFENHSDDEFQSKSDSQDVRNWLENWFNILDQAQKLRNKDSDSEHEIDLIASNQSNQDDIKIQPLCTCLDQNHQNQSLNQNQNQTSFQDDDEKPLVPNDGSPVAKKVKLDKGKQPLISKLNVIIPSVKSQFARNKKSKRLTPPSKRSYLRNVLIHSSKIHPLPSQSTHASTSSNSIRNNKKSIQNTQEAQNNDHHTDNDHDHRTDNDNDEDEDDFDVMDLLRKPSPCLTQPFDRIRSFSSTHSLSNSLTPSPSIQKFLHQGPSK